MYMNTTVIMMTAGIGIQWEQPRNALHMFSTCGWGMSRRIRPQREGHLKIYALDPNLTQDIILGGAIAASVGAALVLGLQKEPEVCSRCNGSGGVVCFACGGSGVMESRASPEIQAEMRRENVGRTMRKNECRACKGVGRLLCKQCRGSGYS